MLKSFTMKSLVISCFVFLTLGLSAQNTVGLLSYNPALASDGYNLYFPHRQGNTFLLNNCGELVHVWEDTVYNPGNSVYLDETGKLYKCIGRGAASNGYIHAGGGGEALEIRDWDNTLLWRWFYNDSTVRLHHDIAVKPNGNILAVAWELKDTAEVLAAGRDTSLPGGPILWPDHIIEVEPIETDSANIVWRWNAWDHLIQDFDSSKQNYGIVGDHPELIDLNFGENSNNDWHHINAIDFNEELNQIVLSVPTFDEIWIIDHSTTTNQAAGHIGGLAGRGGDLLYRWGNPEAYDQGDSSDQKLFFQHDVQWVDDFLSPSHADYGKIMVFNNRVGSAHSTVNTFVSSWDMYTWDYVKTGNVFGPADFDWTYQRPDSQNMHSTGLSSVQRMENGNTLTW